MSEFYACIVTNWKREFYFDKELLCVGVFDSEAKAIIAAAYVLDALYPNQWRINSDQVFNYQFIHTSGLNGMQALGNVWEFHGQDADDMIMVPYDEFVDQNTAGVLNE